MSTSLADTHMSGEFENTARDFARPPDPVYARSGVAPTAVKSHLVYGRLGRRLRALDQSRFCDYLDHRPTRQTMYRPAR